MNKKYAIGTIVLIIIILFLFVSVLFKDSENLKYRQRINELEYKVEEQYYVIDALQQ